MVLHRPCVSFLELVLHLLDPLTLYFDVLCRAEIFFKVNLDAYTMSQHSLPFKCTVHRLPLTLGDVIEYNPNLTLYLKSLAVFFSVCRLTKS